MKKNTIETKRMKEKIGNEYVQLISDSRFTVDNMAATDIKDAFQTKHGMALVNTFKEQSFNKGIQFSNHNDPISTIGDLFLEVYEILEIALERGDVSEEDIENYEDRVNKLKFIMIDLEHYSGSMRDLFDSFNGEVKPEIAEIINRRSETNY